MEGRRRLVLLTDGFPYGRGEKPFILPELAWLTKEFDVTIIAPVTQGQLDDSESFTRLPEEVELVTYRRPGKVSSVFGALAMPFDTVGRMELSKLIRDGVTWGRLADSAYAYSSASSLRGFMKKRGLFDSTVPTVFFSFWFSRGCLAVAMEKYRNVCIRLVSRAHGYDLYEERMANARQPFQTFKADLCDRIVFISRQGMQYFIERFGVERDPGQYQLNYLGIGFPEVSNPAVSRSGRKRVVSCSNVIEVKRVQLLCEAIARLGDLDVEWIHFGDGPLLELVREKARRLGVRASFMGHVSNEDVLAYYARNTVDVFVNVSASEGLPVSLMEAMSYGIPLVATDVGGSGETIDGNGLLLPSDSTAGQVADAIREVLCAQLVVIERMRAASRRLALDRFEVGARKRELLGVLGSV